MNGPTRKQVEHISVDTGVITYLRWDGKDVTLCVLDDRNSAFYHFKLAKTNVLRLNAECAHEILRSEHIYYHHEPSDG
jgi:hypothetical protein